MSKQAEKGFNDFIETSNKAQEELIKELEKNHLFGAVSYDSIRVLEGKMLTIIDASFQDLVQRKAVKDLIRRAIWFDWVNGHIVKDQRSQTGMPSLED